MLEEVAVVRVEALLSVLDLRRRKERDGMRYVGNKVGGEGNGISLSLSLSCCSWMWYVDLENGMWYDKRATSQFASRFYQCIFEERR